MAKLHPKQSQKAQQLLDDQVRGKLPVGVKLVRTLWGHKEYVTRIAWSPDGRILASPSADRTIRLWNVASGDCLAELKGHRDLVWSVAYDPSGDIVASAGHDNKVNLWNATHGNLIRTLEGHENEVWSVAFHPTMGVLASGGNDASVRIWDTSSGRLLQTLRPHKSSVNSLAFDKSGHLLATGSLDYTVGLSNAETWKFVQRLQGHRSSVLSVAFDPGNHFLASGNQDKTIKIWDPEIGKLLRTLEGHTGALNCVAFSAVASLLASKASDGTVRLWRPESGESVATIPHEPSENWAGSLAFHPSLPILATVGVAFADSKEGDCAIRIWELDLPIMLGKGAARFPANGLSSAPAPQSAAEATNRPSSQISISSREAADPPPSNSEFDRIIRALVDGNEGERSGALTEIQTSRSLDRPALASRLRHEITTRFGLEQAAKFAAANRDPNLLPSIRSWMVSSLIWTEAEESENRDYILKHLREETEPERNVRFWALAGLYQRQASYLGEAVALCNGDSMPEVSGLAKAIAAPTDPEIHKEFRAQLLSNKFETKWPVLRLLRVIPIPELTGDVCALLNSSANGTALVYDAFYALVHPTMAQEAAKVLSQTPGVDRVVQRLLGEARGSNENAVRSFSLLLSAFDATAVDRALENAKQQPGLRAAAELTQKYLRTWRQRQQNVVFERNYSSFVPDRTVYGPRAAGEPLDDSLGVRVYAEHIAQLIAARETWMPLSIGLFGPWGSGKTYFIDLLDESLAALPKGENGAFHQHIVQIRFNAWHYLDTNLWANLVCEIFDQLFRKLDKDASVDQVQKLKNELAQQSALAAEANEALKTTEAARVKAEDDLGKAVAEREQQELDVRSLLDDLGTLLKNNSAVQGQLKTVADRLGLPKLSTSFSELEARAAEVRSLEGRVKAVALVIFSGPRWWMWGLLVVAAIAVPLGVNWLSNHGWPWLQEVLAGTNRVIAQVIAAVGVVSAWISQQVKTGNTMVGKLESAYDEVKAVRSKRESQDDAAKAQKELAALRQVEETARHRLHEAEEKMKAISAELAELAPGRQLIRFLKARASAEDYRRHLGLVSLVRKDFEQLSELLTSTESKKDPTLPTIDRIVLYIDDLDRCRADRVIEVLEAVHLLLAFPLFAVVVAVDPRWLRQSLLDHYPRLLGGNDSNGDPTKSQVRVGRPATPQDYLEKIFQVPFNLQRIEKDGFETLVSHLFRPPKPRDRLPEKNAELPPKPAPQPDNAPIPESASTMQSMPPTPVPNPARAPTQMVSSSPAQSFFRKLFSRRPRSVAPTSATTAPAVPTVDPKPAVQSKAVPVEPKKAEEQKKDTQPTSADPKRLTLTDKEVKDVQRFQPLFQTPRAVKRMANTYCLIRVGVDEKDWTAYLGPGNTPGNYRIPMLMLAVTSAFPSLARPWLLWIMEANSKKWALTPQDIDALTNKYGDITSKTDWEQLSTALNQIKLDDWPDPKVQALSEWVPRVARYSF